MVQLFAGLFNGRILLFNNLFKAYYLGTYGLILAKNFGLVCCRFGNGQFFLQIHESCFGFRKFCLQFVRTLYSLFNRSCCSELLLQCINLLLTTARSFGQGLLHLLDLFDQFALFLDQGCQSSIPFRNLRFKGLVVLAQSHQFMSCLSQLLILYLQRFLQLGSLGQQRIMTIGSFSLDL